MRFLFSRWLVVFLAVFALAAGLEAQVAAPPPPVADARAEALKKELADARNTLARFSEAGVGSRLPEGIAPAQLVERIQDLDQLVRALGSHLSLLDQKRDADRDLTAARATEEAWMGFKEDPPYSMLWADDLTKRLALLSEKKASHQSSIALFERTLEGVEKEATAVIAAKEAAEVPLATAEAPTAAAKWLAEAAAWKHRLVVARANSLRANIELMQVKLAIVTSERNLLENELRVVRRNVDFSDEDLEKLGKAATERQTAIRKEIADTNRKLREAQIARNAANLAADKQPVSEADVEIRRLQLSAAETRAEVLQFIAENLGALEGIEGYVATAYQNRRTLAGTAPKATREAALQSLTSLRDRVAAREVVATNELAAVNADLTQQGVVAADIPAGDPRAAPQTEIRAALWTKQSFLQRVVQSTGDLRKSLSGWVDENSVAVERTVATRFRDSLSYAWVKIRSVWDINVSKYEEITPTGAKIFRTVKLGTIIKALLFFGIAYLILASISRRMQRVVVRRNHIGEAQANTLRTWIMIVVAFGLALATLNFLSIPLTLFAFFGGALAIGLGFGTQTLIKNFISGIIVLFERKIRVGDIVDVGGIAGSITEINTRSSVLRGADGRETLVPNSQFLENQVTNLTLSNRRVRRTLRVKVALGTSPQEVSTILLECADRHGLVLKTPAPVATFDDFADNAHVFAIYYWTDLNAQTDSDVVASDLRFMIDKRFTETGIRFPASKQEPPAPPAPNTFNG